MPTQLKEQTVAEIMERFANATAVILVDYRGLTVKELQQLRGKLRESGSERELRRLVGPNGEVLEALQDLSRLAVQAKTGERSRLMLDVAGFRAARRRTLEELAAKACQEVQRTGEAMRLEPMSAFERKVVHDVVADAGLVSESEGEDPSRRVVVFPASA